MGIEDIRNALVARERSTFLLTDPDGNVPAGNVRGLGVYHADTRHLSAYNLTLNGIQPVILLSTAELGYAMEQVMTNPTVIADGDRTVARGTVEIRRERVIGSVIEETLSLTNYNPFPVTLHLLYEFGADFADIFDVRGYEREQFGRSLAPKVTDNTILYRYAGVDRRTRETSLSFDRKPDYIDESTALFRVTLPGRETACISLDITIDGHAPRERTARGLRNTIADEYAQWLQGCTQITTDNEFFNRVLTRSVHDVRMLWSQTDAGEPYPAAGTPWFDAPFGRDSCIMAMQMLMYRPDIARNVLQLLARWQGKGLNPARDEEPGKILHELRFDELSRSGELPYSPYYGSIDSTPLFLMLAAAYYDWTADLRLIKVLLPAIRAAFEWMDKHGDAGGNGYLAYEKRSAKGLVNQGWKDSWDAVVHTDGALARPPIALVEAQGYAYAARMRLAPAIERLGDAKLAERLRRHAKRLHRRFNDDFWMEERGCYALALDGEGARVESIATNPAHGLWTGIVDPMRADSVIDRLMSDDMFSGWGLRTLSGMSPRYNPLGYHVGTVWPHDNSIAAMGFKMYGREDALVDLAGALFDAAVSFAYFRLPELFGGEQRTASGPPVPYPVACNPQSWAAGTFPLVTQALLGLKPEAPEGRLRIVNPRLPSWLHRVTVKALRVGNGTATIGYRRNGDETHVEVHEASGVDVVIGGRWGL